MSSWTGGNIPSDILMSSPGIKNAKEAHKFGIFTSNVDNWQNTY